MDYYLKSHMPLVHKSWATYGLTGWKVVQFSDDQPYCVQAILSWESEDSYKKALQSDTVKAVMDDVANFADKQPTFLSGTVVGSS